MDTRVLTYRTIIKKDGKFYHGFVPLLPGCHTSGKTIEETKENLREAIEGWIETRVANNLSVPKEDGLEFIETINLDTLEIPQGVIRYA